MLFYTRKTERIFRNSLEITLEGSGVILAEGLITLGMTVTLNAVYLHKENLAGYASVRGLHGQGVSTF